MTELQKGVIYDWNGGDERELLADWVKPGAWCFWYGAFSAPPGCGTHGAWWGQVTEVYPKEYSWGYDKVMVVTPGDSEGFKLAATQISSMDAPMPEALDRYTKAYLEWVNRPDSK